MPGGHLEFVAVHQREMLWALVRDYDGSLEGNLDFPYCDTVADFYTRVWERTADRRVRSCILKRLLDLGRTHNRWSCQKAFVRLTLPPEDGPLG